MKSHSIANVLSPARACQALRMPRCGAAPASKSNNRQYRFPTGFRVVLLGLLIGSFVLGMPDLCHACPVCFQAQNDDNRVAFLVTTIFMTATPLVLIAVAVWWFRRRMKQLEREARGVLNS
ncbi:MAG: hypothetical protein MJD61_11480 [Proteobacteria bacterium]|nr:hypothetical protein [Pseudomonadota bacterium]